MQFPGYWVANEGKAIRVEKTTFDETDLSESSRWTEAHQNAEPGMPSGYVSPSRVIQEVARRLLEAHPELVNQRDGADTTQVVSTLEEFGLLCLRLADGLAPEETKNPIQVENRDPTGSADDEIPF